MTKLSLLLVMVIMSSVDSASADEIRGVVTLQSSNCPVPNLLVEVDPPINSPEPRVVTTTDQDGSFTARVKTGQYLLVIYQQGIKVYQSELRVMGTTIKSLTLAPSGTSGGTPCYQPNTAKARLTIKGIEIPHNGSPFSTSWRFEVFVNDLGVAGVTEHTYDRNEKWRPLTDWPPLSVPATGVLVVRIKGYQGGKKHADGSSKYTFGSGAGEEFSVEVSCDHKAMGNFIFHFIVGKLLTGQT